MALKLTRKMPGVEGAILAGNTLTFRLPIGLTFHQVFFEYAMLATATPVALEDAFGEIRVLKNGRPTWAIQASELDKMNQFQSRQPALGILTLDFDRYNLRTRPAEEYTSVGTGAKEDPTPLTTFVIEMDIKAGSAITGGTITARAKQSDSRVLGMFKKIRRYNHVFTGAGIVEIADYPRGELINSIAMFESANDIDAIRVERDNFVLFDRSKELNARIQSDGVRTPQADVFAIDTSEDGNGTDQFVTEGVSDFRFFITIDGAMTITSLVEYIGSLGL